MLLYGRSWNSYSSPAHGVGPGATAQRWGWSHVPRMWKGMFYSLFQICISGYAFKSRYNFDHCSQIDLDLYSYLLSKLCTELTEISHFQSHFESKKKSRALTYYFHFLKYVVSFLRLCPIFTSSIHDLGKGHEKNSATVKEYNNNKYWTFNSNFKI